MASTLKIERSEDLLLISGTPLMIELPESIQVFPDPLGAGSFLQFTASSSQARHVFPIGSLQENLRFTCCHRYEPYWMTVKAGTRGDEVPVETQFLLVERPDHTVALLVPLLDGAFRCALQGSGEDAIELVAELGDPAVVTDTVTGLFIAAGSDPFSLIEESARSVMQHMGIGRLRADKPVPEFIDLFGWCTWDAFYQEVSHEKVRQGLESFARGGILPKLLILDDGWQSEQGMPTGERRLTSFAANDKFPGGLAPTVRMAKDEFGVETFLVWHALAGYWGGVHPPSFPQYDVQPVARSFSPGILHYYPDHNENWWGSVIGVISPNSIDRFYQDYHRSLRQQGVDGVKVDTQASLEAVSAGRGGRVGMMQRYHEALEGSAQVHFGGRLINCMSLSNDMLYSALSSNLTRTSTDFWPERPHTHGLHLYVNAQVSLWFGEFIHPDWDMFQSGHPWGGYHAAARAISGGPVYVSDKPGTHDFDLLRKLVLPDGRTLRALQPARLTRDCLFHDPTREDVLLKIFNLNYQAGVIGVFNARYDPQSSGNGMITGSITPKDVAGLEGELFAIYAHNSRELRLIKCDEQWELALPQAGFEIFTVVPVDQGVAPLGLVELFNSAGAVVEKSFITPEIYRIKTRGAGRFALWCSRKPVELISVDTRTKMRTKQAMTYMPENSYLEFQVDHANPVMYDIILNLGE